MAIGASSLIEVTMGMLWFGQQTLNVYQYEVDVWPNPTSAINAAEAWWNHVKTDYRALIVSGGGRNFNSVTVRELNNPTGDLAEFSIPSAEEGGTRSAGSLGAFLASFNAVGVRLTVGSRATRSGQKRIVGLTEGDVQGNDVSSGFIPLVENLMDTMTTHMILGAPSALVELSPIVCRKDITGAVTASQPVTGYVVNPFLTTQNTRKFGRGA
jgi:hypothetical protein